MTPGELCHLRLAHQQISVRQSKKPADVVSWMGAMQAQDYNMVRWAVALRMADADESAIRHSIDAGEIIRTHVLRPTWHLVAANDASWMIDLAAPQIKTVARFRQKELELTPAVLKKSLATFEKCLAGNRHLTREQVLAELTRKKIDTTGQRAAHILLWAELEKVICSGATAGKKTTYALFDERVKAQKKVTREEALVRLGMRYFTSRGPASLSDFINWSMLPRTEARKAVESIKGELVSEKIGSEVYWFRDSGMRIPLDPSVYLLPAFDEFIIGYKDRSAVLPPKHKSSVMSINGIFWPVIVVNGMVTGLWKRTVSNERATVKLEWFSRRRPGDIGAKRLVEEATERVRNFFSAA